MPFEFIAKNGLISKNNVTVTGSLIVTGQLVGPHVGTSSWSNNAITASNATISNGISFVPTVAVSASAASSSVSSSFSSIASAITFVPIVTISASIASSSISASYAPVDPAYSASISTVKQNTLITGNTYNITSSWSNSTTSTTSASYAGTASVLLGSITSASYSLTASFALNGGVIGPTISSSWASQSLSSSFVSSYQSNTIVLTSSLNWITASFDTANQQVNLSVAAAYNLTCSNNPFIGQISDVLIYISHSAATSSSLSFPSTWMNVGAGWPTAIPANTVGVLWLRAINNNSIIGTFNYSGSVGGTSSYSLAALSAAYAPGSPSVSASYSSTASWAITATNANAISFVPTVAVSASFASSSLSASYLNSTVLTISASGLVGINSSSFNSVNPETILIRSISSTSPNLLVGVGNLNNYLQLNINNDSNGATGSSDIVATADVGNESIAYIDMGINSSGYNIPAFSLGGPLDGYIYVVASGSVGGDLTIGSLSTGSIIFHTQGSSIANERMRIDTTGSIGIGVSKPAHTLEVNGTFQATNATASFTGSLVGTVVGNITGNVTGTASVATVATSATTATSASYSTASFNGAKAWAFVSQSGVTLTTTAYGCAITRISAGLYGVRFNSAPPTANYAAVFNGYSGSGQITCSVGYPLNQTTVGFSMSVSLVSTPLVRADFQNGSISVFSF